MKIKTLHIVWFWVLMLCHYQSLFCANTSQEPQQIRQFENDFKERYSGEKYNYEGDAIVTNTPSGSGKYEAYKTAEDRRKERNNQDDFSINLGPLSWLFYLAIALAVIYLAYILFNEGGSGLFSSKQHKKVNGFEEITAENIENADIDALIKDAETNNNFRLAIRYYYLLVLKNLSLKSYIKFEDDKTNSEYLNEVSTTPFNDKFVYTSYLYNYIWYGEFSVNLEQYNKAKSNFITLLNQVK
ncbi:hypothetical protein L3X39_11550 [Sabulilitoribacter multivorans]|uniref:DUF4129 domain-containing protein n=1 Tax=Flaviramulus multivorans TaxID=1304750 RepID=A0ABS9IKY8_9FLAO|nr:hypothetical protein [Flaviramulus multivorans]MCF7561273.1 hypothetical protein [Flaviramulus multivorans]